MNNYPGESDSKRVARYWVHKAALGAFEALGFTPRGKYVALAGPIAGDLGCIEHLLHWPLEDVVMVDKVGKYVQSRTLKKRGIKTSHKNIRTAIQEIDRSIGFLNLDLMGTFNEDARVTLSAAHSKILVGGIVSCTFYRGREKGKDFEEIVNYAKSHKMDLDMARFELYNKKALAALWDRGGKKFKRIMSMSYSSDNSPMGVIVYQHIPDELLESPVIQAEFDHVKEKGRMPIGIANPQDSLRMIAIHLRKTKLLTAKQVGEILNVPSSTVSAWWAHETMGTYEGRVP